MVGLLYCRIVSTLFRMPGLGTLLPPYRLGVAAHQPIYLGLSAPYVVNSSIVCRKI
jgi:hypothetical protein